jgi:hypothetical protein
MPQLITAYTPHLFQPYPYSFFTFSLKIAFTGIYIRPQYGYPPAPGFAADNIWGVKAHRLIIQNCGVVLGWIMLEHIGGLKAGGSKGSCMGLAETIAGISPYTGKYLPGQVSIYPILLSLLYKFSPNFLHHFFRTGIGHYPA